MSDFSNFRAVYDELTDEVIRSKHQFMQEHIANWFTVIDDTPEASGLVQHLQGRQDVQEFLKRSAESAGSFVGSATLDWPKDRDKRLGMKLLIFREIAEGRIEAWQFGHEYMYAGNVLDDNASAVAEQLFEPTARELRRYLEAHWGKVAVPASDRVVRRDDNTRALFDEAIGALKRLEEALQGQNAFDSTEEKDQLVAELSAGQRLLQAAQVRVDALVAVLKKPLSYIGRKFMDTGLSKLAGLAIERIAHLIGSMF